MGFGISLLCVGLLIYLGVWGGVRLYAHFRSNFFCHHQELVETIALYLALLSGASLLSMFSFLPVQVTLFLGISGLGILSFARLNQSKKWKIFLQGVLCLLGVLCLYPFSHEGILFTFLLALLWGIMWRIIVWFDRFALTSLIVFLGWSIGLVTTGLLIHTLPNTVVSAACLLGVLTLVVGSFRLSQKQSCLGPYVASFFGFMWAGVWVYFLNLGAVFQTFSAFGYYVFELIILVLAFFHHQPLQSFLEKLLMSPRLASQAVKIVLAHVVMFSFLAAMTVRMHMAVNSLLFFVIGIILLDLYLRLNALENPTPTWREMMKNTRQEMLDFVGQVKKIHPFEKKTARQKIGQKKAVSKKRVQKKGTHKK